jgi:hypothetical protein
VELDQVLQNTHGIVEELQAIQLVQQLHGPTE